VTSDQPSGIRSTLVARATTITLSKTSKYRCQNEHAMPNCDHTEPSGATEYRASSVTVNSNLASLSQG
jgi:hypothetical protein